VVRRGELQMGPWALGKSRKVVFLLYKVLLGLVDWLAFS